MLGGCLISTAGYTFLADVYYKKRVTSESGQQKYTWETQITNLPCAISTFSSTSFKAQANSETFKDVYTDFEYLILTCGQDLGKSVQVSNIRSITTGEIIFNDVDLVNSPPTWFNSNGSTPQIDPYGRIIRWDTLIHRAEQQGGL